jgi:hypothetical protein
LNPNQEEPGSDPVVVAECPACGERRFRAEREALEPGDIVTCEACGLKLSYGFLQSRMEQASPEPRRSPVRTATRRKKAKRKRR